MQITSKAVFPFEPSRSVAVDSVAVAYSTHADFRENLADLARLSYLKARARYRVTLSGASGTGAATLTLTGGANDYLSVDLDLASATTFYGAYEVDFSGIAGQTALMWKLDVTTAAEAAVTAEVVGHVAVESPLVIGTC